MRKILLTITVAITFICAGCFSTQKEEDDLRSYLDSNIHIGESKADVIRFLEANSIKHDMQPRLIPAPNGKDCDWMIAWIEKRTFIHGNYSLHIYLYFDRRRSRFPAAKTAGTSI